MHAVKEQKICPSCSHAGYGKFCAECGQPFQVKRITIASLGHDAFHLLTHLDKGFLFSLKQLIERPGTMQRRFIEGDRNRHQKPFSMFFLCATIAGLGRYWINLALLRYFDSGNETEAHYFHQYMVLLQIALIPFYIFITWICFKRSRYNYAETGVLVLYASSVFFLMVTLISLLKFIWHDLDTAYIELPLLIIYNGITFVKFYNDKPAARVFVKSLLVILAIFATAHFLEKLIIQIM